MEPTFFSKKRKVIMILLYTIVAVIVVGTICFGVKDTNTIKRIKMQVGWLEQFYTEHARYPSEEEFYGYFEKNKKINPQIENYSTIDDDKKTNDAQNFSLKYKLHNEGRGRGLGGETYADLIYDYNEVTPCNRWKKVSQFAPKMTTRLPSATNKLDSSLKADLKQGTISLIKASLPEKIVLQGLKQPRFITPHDGFWYEKNDIIITNGADILKYTWDGAVGTLENPEKIGTVPTSCPSDTNYNWPEG